MAVAAVKRKKPVFAGGQGLLTSKEAAQFIGICSQTLALWRCHGKFRVPYIKAGGRKILYRIRDLEQWLESQTVVPANHDVA